MINKNEKHNTTIGGILTLFLIFFSILAFVAFGRDIFEKKSPSVILGKNPSKEVAFDFSNSTFVMTIYAGGTNAPIPELEKLFRIYIVLQDIDPSKTSIGQSIVENQIDLKKCPPEKLTPEVNETIFLPFENYYCLPDNMSIPLSGTWNNGKFKVLKLNVDYCLNTTQNNNTCYSKDKIAKLLPSTFNMNYVIFDKYTDNNDYLNPIKSTVYGANIRSNINTMSRLIFWFKNVDYVTDDGWILEDLRNETFTAIDHIETQIFPTPNTSSFFFHMFTLAPLKDSYRRSYIKIQGVSAYIGGFISFFKMFLGIVCLYVSYPYYLDYFFKCFINCSDASQNLNSDRQTNNVFNKTNKFNTLYELMSNNKLIDNEIKNNIRKNENRISHKNPKKVEESSNSLNSSPQVSSNLKLSKTPLNLDRNIRIHKNNYIDNNTSKNLYASISTSKVHISLKDKNNLSQSQYQTSSTSKLGHLYKIVKPEKLEGLKVLFRCFSISSSNKLKKYLSISENLLKDNLSIENMCKMFYQINLLEDKLLNIETENELPRNSHIIDNDVSRIIEK